MVLSVFLVGFHLARRTNLGCDSGIFYAGTQNSGGSSERSLSVVPYHSYLRP